MPPFWVNVAEVVAIVLGFWVGWGVLGGRWDNPPFLLVAVVGLGALLEIDARWERYGDTEEGERD